VSVVLDVPKDAVGITYGLLLVSGGEVWIDDASIEVVGVEVPTTMAPSPQPTPANVDQQRLMYARAPLAPVNLGFEPDR
jgi:hypothetical protein